MGERLLDNSRKEGSIAERAFCHVQNTHFHSGGNIPQKEI